MSHIDPWVAVVTLLSLLFYLCTSTAVARARALYKVAAPAMTGHPAFERAVRVQMNTLEWLPIYLPSLWLFADFVSAPAAAALGVVWILGRVGYMWGYLQAANKRGPGFLVQSAATLILTLGALVGAALKIVTGGV
jgi:glutathione S-transferase